MVVFNLQYNTTKVDNVSPFISNWLACFFTTGHWVFFPVHNIIISTSFHMFGISHFFRYAVFFHIFIFYATLKVHLCKKQILWQSFLNDFYHLKRIIPKLWYIYREYCHLKKETIFLHGTKASFRRYRKIRAFFKEFRKKGQPNGKS